MSRAEYEIEMSIIMGYREGSGGSGKRRQRTKIDYCRCKNRRDRRIMRDGVENVSLLWHTNATLINLLLPPRIKKSIRIRIHKGNSESKPIKNKL